MFPLSANKAEACVNVRRCTPVGKSKLNEADLFR